MRDCLFDQRWKCWCWCVLMIGAGLTNATSAQRAAEEQNTHLLLYSLMWLSADMAILRKAMVTLFKSEKPITTELD